MKLRAVATLCCIAVLGLFATVARAVEEGEAQKPKKVVKAVIKTDVKKNEKVSFDKLVDINSASKIKLTKLPKMTPELADKIIAGRPYGSKVWLLTNKIIPETNYNAIWRLIAAKNPQAALKQIQQKDGKKK